MFAKFGWLLKVVCFEDGRGIGCAWCFLNLRMSGRHKCHTQRTNVQPSNVDTFWDLFQHVIVSNNFHRGSCKCYKNVRRRRRRLEKMCEREKIVRRRCVEWKKTYGVSCIGGDEEETRTNVQLRAHYLDSRSRCKDELLFLRTHHGMCVIYSSSQNIWYTIEKEHSHNNSSSLECRHVLSGISVLNKTLGVYTSQRIRLILLHLVRSNVFPLIH